MKRVKLGSKLIAVDAPTTTSGAVSPMAREIGQDRPGQDAGHGVGKNMRPDRLPFGCADPKTRITQRARHGADRLLGIDDDDGKHEQAQGQARQRGRSCRLP